MLGCIYICTFCPCTNTPHYCVSTAWDMTHPPLYMTHTRGVVTHSRGEVIYFSPPSLAPRYCMSSNQLRDNFHGDPRGNCSTWSCDEAIASRGDVTHSRGDVTLFSPPALVQRHRDSACQLTKHVTRSHGTGT